MATRPLARRLALAAVLFLLVVAGLSVSHADTQCPDLFEPNETYLQAIAIQPGTLHSYICDWNDTDYFKFEAGVGDNVVIHLDSLPDDYNLCLYDRYMNLIECSSNVGTSAEHIDVYLQAVGWHYIYVYGAQGAYHSLIPYRLGLTKSGGTPSVTPSPLATSTPTPTLTPDTGCPDGYEPNDSCSEAWPVNTGFYHAYICTSSDEDWFLVDLLLDQELTVTLGVLPQNYDLAIYSPVGTELARSTNPAIDIEKINLFADEVAGRYCIKVWGHAGAHDPDNTYTLQIELGPEPSLTPTPSRTATPMPTVTCMPDEWEPNDSRAEAAAIPTRTEIGAQLCPRGDHDYYSFDVLPCSNIYALLYDLPDNYWLELLDPDGERLSLAGGAGTTDREISRDVARAGTYTVHVYPGSGADSPDTYHLYCDVSPPSGDTIFWSAKDAYVFSGSPGANYGCDRFLRVGRDEFGFEYRSFVQVDVSGLEEDMVGSAYLVMRLEDYDNHGAPEVEVRRILDAWGESSVTWSAMPVNVAYGESAAVSALPGTDFMWDVTELVRAWVSGDALNYGMELRYVGDETGYRGFRSSEFGSMGPRLEILCAGAPSGSASISGAVFHDEDADGERDGGEDGLGGVGIELIDQHLGRVDGTVSDADGNYTFGSVPIRGAASTYDVVVDETTLDTTFTWQWLRGPIESVSVLAGDVEDDVDFRVAARPTPMPGPTPHLDFTAEDMDLVQVLFDEPLVKGKATLARVYVGLAGEPGPVEVSGRLFHGLDSILPIAPARVINSAFANPKDDPLVYENLDRTLNFWLPDAWTRMDDLHLTAWVNYANPGDECPGCWNSENQYTPHPDPHFRTPSSYDITMVAVTLDGVAPTTTSAWTVDYLLRTYPINTVNVTDDSMSLTGIDLSDTSGTGCGPEWRELLEELDSLYVFGSLGDDSEPRVYGMVHESTNDPSGWSGCGYTPGTTAAGVTTPGGADGGIIMAHETGHNLGLTHTCCSGEPDCDTHHPGGGIGRQGIDLSNPASPRLIPVWRGHDIMTYCGDRWPADHSYSHLLNIFTGSPGATSLARELAVDADHLVALGSIEQGNVTFSQPYYVVPAPLGAYMGGGEGQYRLELRDGGDQMLDWVAFDAAGDSENPVSDGDGPFRAILPWNDNTASVAIVDGEADLAITLVSEHKPEVAITEPIGTHWPAYGTHTVAWDASDEDGAPLEYVLQFSPDGGEDWKTLATGLIETTYQCDAARLPGTRNGRFRVLASDGVLTGMAVSEEALVVDGKPPVVTILSPQSGRWVAPGELTRLRAISSDLEDGPAGEDPREPFRWWSSQDGELGAGAILDGAVLSPGRHTIAVTWTDSDGITSMDEVVVEVGQFASLPLIMCR